MKKKGQQKGYMELLCFLGPDACGMSGVKQGGIAYGSIRAPSTCVPIMRKRKRVQHKLPIPGTSQYRPDSPTSSSSSTSSSWGHTHCSDYEEEYDREYLALKQEKLRLERDKLNFSKSQLGD